MTTESQPANLAAPFLTTRWTRVCMAKADSADGRKALADLCDAYYEPVIACLRSVLRDADAAREMSHAFFAEMLGGGTIHTADPERGRFRFYLLGAVRHFLASQRESENRQRRGGGARRVMMDDDLRALTRLDRLSTLRLEGWAGLAGHGMGHLREKRKLSGLTLANCPDLNEEGMSEIAQFSGLEDLSIAGAAKVGDSAIPHLARLKKLKALTLTGTAITDAGVETLKKALPECVVTR